MTEARVLSLYPAYRDDIGDLVTRRPLPGPGLDHLGAFLFLNHHGPQSYGPDNRGLPFGPHPHRGFETVTFILEGELAHLDSAGNESVIGAGGVQWMTAGSGLVHAEISPEDFKRSGGPLEILQLWVNLPAALKMTHPRYSGVQADALPAIGCDGARVHLVAGEWHGRQGPIDSLTGVFMTYLTMQPGSELSFGGIEGRDVFLYVARGAVRIGGTDVPKFNLAQLTPGDRVTIEAREQSLLLFGHADPLDEPVVAYGPFVMNSQEEIRQAITDYQAGKFGAELADA
jgi:redox-sensitive bicupin YhaK (pirin superfamily)